VGFFEFVAGLSYYADRRNAAARLNQRHHFLIEAFQGEIADARVLDLAAHDGRWSYAFAAAGAREVVAIEARAEMIGRFADYPDPRLKARVEMRQGDIFEALAAEAAAGAHYDVVAVFGILYHVMDHFRLFQLLHPLTPRLIIVDSLFLGDAGAVIRLVKERTDKVLNAAPQISGQRNAVKGIVSFRAMAMIAEVLGYSIEWSDWSQLAPPARTGVQDYFTSRHGMRRASCALRPCRQ